MKAITFLGERKLTVADVPDPKPGPQDVVIEVTASGMCGSDLHAYRGPHLNDPRIAGHEPAGHVVDVGAEVDRSWIGRSVMVHHYIGCGTCDQCTMGWTQLCREGTRPMGVAVDGAHAEFLVVPVATVMARPEGLSDLAAAAISCGTGTAWSALHRLELAQGDTIAIFGQGPVGLAATQLAHALGAHVIALDISPDRLQRATEFGADDVIDPSEMEGAIETVRSLTDGRGVAKSLDTSGASIAANAAVAVLDLWGSVCWVGVGAQVELDLRALLYRQIRAMTSWTMSVAAMEECARFIVDHAVDVDALFTDRWSLDDAVRAYELFDQQTSGKGVFLP